MNDYLDRAAVSDLYFQWLVDTVKVDASRWSRIMKKLYLTPFKSPIAMDSNRAADGVRLRRMFADGYDRRQSDYISIACLEGPCNMLEMMVALAIRCEKDIMQDDTYGDRTDEWFWIMIHNLKLDEFPNGVYDDKRVRDILRRFNRHDFGENGEGSLFIVNDPPTDANDAEVWTQMCLYLNDHYFNTFECADF